MFFIGISAHILIYFLVPAFLVVCLFFNGKSDTLEATDFLPVCVMHESQISAINYNDTYIYEVSECVLSEEKEKLTFHVFIPLTEFPEIVKTYRSPEIDGHSLRAPPAMILDC